MPPPTDLGPDWPRLRISSAVAAFGDGVLATALPLLALGATRNPLAVGAVIAAHRLPTLVAVLAEHALFCRADHRTTIGGLGSLRAVAVATLGAAELLGAMTVGLLIGCALLIGLAQAVGDDATHAAASLVVPRRDSVRMDGRLSITGVGAEWLGLPTGAALFSVATPLPLLVDMLAFAVAGLLALSLPTPAGGPGSAPAPPAWQPGVRTLVRSRPLRSVTVAGCLSNLATSAGLAMLVLLAVHYLELTPIGFGGLLTGLAAATVLGASLAPTLAHWIGAGPALAVSLGVAALGYASVAMLDDVLAAAAGLAIAGSATAAATVLALAVLHAAAPGPEGAASRRAHHVFMAISVPAGALGGGAAALGWGLRAPYIAGAAILGLAAILAAPATSATSTSTHARNNQLTYGSIRGAINA